MRNSASTGPANSVFSTCFERRTGSSESGNSTVESTNAPSPFPEAQNNFAFTRGSPGFIGTACVNSLRACSAVCCCNFAAACNRRRRIGK